MLWVLAGVTIVTIFIFSHVDDWSRDLTTNVAQTDESSETLKPLRIAKPPTVVLQDLLALVDSMTGWTLNGEPQTQDDGSINLHLVRTTRIMRFKDDVWVNLVPLTLDIATDGASDIASQGGPDIASQVGPDIASHGGPDRGTIVKVRSQSRIGRGDLGQNPRNIRELLGRLGSFR
jgi:uncharacterized protein (DUF1499 family)